MKRLIQSVLAAELILLLPFVAMFFTDEVNWTGSDFVVASVLLAGLGMAYHLIATGFERSTHQAIIGIVLAASIILVWIELAVGIFD